MYLGDIRDNGNETRPSDPSLTRPQLHQEGMAEPSPVGSVNDRFASLRNETKSLRSNIASGLKDLALERERMLNELEQHTQVISKLKESLAINQNRESSLNYSLEQLSPLDFEPNPEYYAETEKEQDVHRDRNGLRLPDGSASYGPGEVMVSGPSHPSMRY